MKGIPVSAPISLLLRCREPRRRPPQRQSLRGRARRPSHRAGPVHGKTGVERPDHRSSQGLVRYCGAGHRARQSGYRQRGLRVRSARLHHGLHCRNGQATVALLHGSRKSESGIRIEPGSYEVSTREPRNRKQPLMISKDAAPIISFPMKNPTSGTVSTA